MTRWGTRNGDSFERLELPDDRAAFCDLTVGHDGAHESDQGQWYGKVRWTSANPENAERVPEPVASRRQP